ncbi:MAG: hypothetical protein H8E66_24465 [Planctomycetes bacterium]|nr:hypothetical protein [Planctomycetota bacterium]
MLSPRSSKSIQRRRKQSRRKQQNRLARFESLEDRRMLAGVPTFVIDDVQQAEGDSGTTAFVFTVSRSGKVNQPSTVDYVAAADTATVGDDFQATSGTLNFSSGEKTKTITVPVIGDTTTEDNETFNVDLTIVDNGKFGDSRGVGTITNDDTGPVVPSLSIDDVTVTEGDASIQFIDAFVTAGSGGLDNPKEFIFGPDGNLFVVGGLSDNVLHYNGATGELLGTFVTDGSGGLDGPQGLLFGPDGNLYVTSRATDEVLRYNGTTGTFMDTFVTSGSSGLDDPLDLAFGVDGNLYVASGGTNEVLYFNGTDGSPLGAFVTAGSGALDRPNGLVFGPDANLYVISFGPESVLRFDGTTGALMGTFVTSASGGLDDPTNLLFGPGGDLYVSSALGDSVLRYDGSTGAFLEAYVSAGSGGLDRPIGLLFDADGNLLVGSRNTDEVLRFGHASQAVFNVSLSLPSADPVTVDFDTFDGTASAGSDYTAASGTLTFAPGETSKTIIVPTTNDTDPEPNETFTVTISNPSAGTTIADGQGVGTIADDDNVNDPNALYVYDIRFESKRGGKDWRAVFEIRNDSNADGLAGSDDSVRAGVTVTVNFAGQTFTGVTDSNGIFRTSWLRNLGSGNHYANAVDLVLAGYFWDPLDLDDEDDSDGDGKPDDLLVL